MTDEENNPEITPATKAAVLAELDTDLDTMVRAIQTATKAGKSREQMFEHFTLIALDQIKSESDQVAIASLLTMAVMRLAGQEMVQKN